ncbi:hypothetical protein BDV26DRAFT_269961 [Aspergillus bertholletiae]|uniref:Uncharacterized protein n=1 Tax=Aspergillus bertholletiae TaxID=1226010 RepID=A0A5N7B030_9EURO|nr:hypothetical protein BDV26DRAFT_269961 [Aspergillus bertholletiae]
MCRRTDIWFTVEFVTIQWDDTNARLGSQKVVSLWSESYDDGSSVTQTSEISQEETVEQTSEFTHLHGASIGVSVEAKVGLPLVGGGSVTASASANTELKWGTVQRFEKKYSIKTTVNWPPNSCMKMSIVVRKGTVDVPFKVTYRSVTTHQEIYMWGLWKGVMSSDQSRRLVKV